MAEPTTTIPLIKSVMYRSLIRLYLSAKTPLIGVQIKKTPICRKRVMKNLYLSFYLLRLLLPIRTWLTKRISIAAINEFRKLPILKPGTKKSANIMVHVLTIRLNKPKVIILSGKVMSNKRGLISRLTRSNTNPRINMAISLPT